MDEELLKDIAKSLESINDNARQIKVAVQIIASFIMVGSVLYWLSN